MKLSAQEIFWTVICSSASTPACIAEFQSDKSKSKRAMLDAAGVISACNTRPSRNMRDCGIRIASLNTSAYWGASRIESSSSDSAETNSPQTLWRGKRPFSSSKTPAPACAAVMAAEDPPGPAPITIRSCIKFPKLKVHSKKIMPRNMQRSVRNCAQHIAHFRYRVRLPHRGRRVMPCEATAEQRQTRIHQRQVQWIPDNIADQKRRARNPHAFASKLLDLRH